MSLELINSSVATTQVSIMMMMMMMMMMMLMLMLMLMLLLVVVVLSQGHDAIAKACSKVAQ